MEPYTIKDTLQNLQGLTERFMCKLEQGTLDHDDGKLMHKGLSNTIDDLAVWLDVKKGKVAIPLGQEEASYELRSSDRGYRTKGIYSNEHRLKA